MYFHLISAQNSWHWSQSVHHSNKKGLRDSWMQWTQPEDSSGLKIFPFALIQNCVPWKGWVCQKKKKRLIYHIFDCIFRVLIQIRILAPVSTHLPVEAGWWGISRHLEEWSIQFYHKWGTEWIGSWKVKTFCFKHSAKVTHSNLKLENTLKIEKELLIKLYSVFTFFFFLINVRKIV